MDYPKAKKTLTRLPGQGYLTFPSWTLHFSLDNSLDSARKSRHKDAMDHVTLHRFHNGLCFPIWWTSTRAHVHPLRAGHKPPSTSRGKCHSAWMDREQSVEKGSLASVPLWCLDSHYEEYRKLLCGTDNEGKGGTATTSATKSHPDLNLVHSVKLILDLWLSQFCWHFISN